jgi:lipoprotein NlpI|tara:strand:+ start:170 stop:487 length:318 start_codon:yes stop_codon:yes gene_type:complete
MIDQELDTLYDATEKDPYKSLYLAVILQAILDITKPENKRENTYIKLQRDQAHAWVFASIGVTCENFEDTCALAGVEPGVVRTFALNVINSGDINEVRRKINTLL